MEEMLDAAGLDPFEDSVEPANEPANPATEPSGEPSQPAEPASPANSDSTDDIIAELLASNGIGDLSKIKFEDESGTVVERSWKDLTKEEKLNILSAGSNTSDNTSLSQEETDLINAIRTSNMSPADYLESLKQEAAQVVNTSTYEIDTISDDELFVLDAIDRYGEENVTDEQLEKLLTNAKADPELYAKTIQSLRAQYKDKEDALALQTQQQEEAAKEQEFQNFSSSILNEIQSLKSVAGQEIELTIDDMNELANYILTRDEEGNSEFGKALNDPKLFTQMAFWALKGNDIMNEISSQIKMAYDKGVEAGKKGQSQLVFNTKKDTKAHTSSTMQSADGLDVQ